MNINDLDIDRIHRAFSPAREIQDPRLFVGRQSEIQDAIGALMNRGGFVAIYGLRGVGKSSIAHQLKLIAEGDATVPNALGIRRMLPKRGFSYLVQYIRCDKFVHCTQDLLKRILFGDDTNPSLFDLTKSGDRKLREFKKVVSTEGGIGAFGTKLSARGTEESSYSSYASDDLVQQFRQLLGTIQKDNNKKSGMLILIDEFDTISDPSGFSSIVKSCSSDFVKFGIIGIATTVSELIRDHTSIGRQIDLIHVPLMPEAELSLILRRGEFAIQKLITFDDDADKMIAQRAEGFPYFVHLLGKESVLSAFERKSTRVARDDVITVFSRITQGRLNTLFETLYHDAVKNSPQRELLLKLFSEADEDEIYTVPIYGAAQDLGISNPAQLMKQLTTPDSPEVSPVLQKVRDRHFRFTDPVFKVFARLRNFKFD